MRNRTFVLPFVIAALVTLPALAAGTVEPLPPAAADLLPRALAPAAVIAVTPAAPEIPRDPVTFAWKVPADRPIAEPTPYRASSREYWRRVTASDLAAGVEIDTTAPGALVRLSPLDDAARAVTLAPDRIELVAPDGRRLTAGEAFSAAAAGAELDRPELAFPPGSAAVRLDEALGAGRFTLRLRGIAADAAGTYLVHVLDAGSPVTLELETARDTVFWGSRLEAVARLARDGRTLSAEAVQARVVAPDGRTFPAEVHRRTDGSLAVAATLDAEPSARPGLWELHLSVRGESDGVPVPRDARTAFALVVPTARLTGEARPVAAEGLALEVGVEVAAPGRYAVSGVLYGTAADGSRAPIAAVEGADWLDGDGWIRLEIPAGLLAGSGLEPPYELDHVALKDQGRVAVLERRARGFRIVPERPDREDRSLR